VRTIYAKTHGFVNGILEKGGCDSFGLPIIEIFFKGPLRLIDEITFVLQIVSVFGEQSVGK
jgi:hypothetical protein